MSAIFASADLTAGQLNAIVKKLGGQEASLKFLRGELSVYEPTRNWREQDGIIYFSVTSDGTTGEEWVARLKEKGFQMDFDAESVLLSADFKPTTGITTEVAVLKGTLFEDKDRIAKNIRKVASDHELEIPNAEIACLIRKMFTDDQIEAMELVWIITMHEPIRDYYGTARLLDANCYGSGQYFDTCHGGPNNSWNHECGFAFAVGSKLVSRVSFALE